MPSVPRLLVLSSWFPYPADNGSRLRAFFLLRELAKVYRIRLIAGAQDDSPEDIPAPLADLCESVIRIPWRWPGEGSRLQDIVSPVPRAIRETANPLLAAAIADELEQYPPDLILALQMGMDTYLAPDIFPHFPVVLEEAEVSGWNRKRLRHCLTYTKSARYWPGRLRRYNAITTVSQAEAEAIRTLIGEGAPPVSVVPNGVDTASYRPHTEAIPGRLIYNGSLTYGPNREAVLWFAHEILPRIAAQEPEAHLIVTGRYGAQDAKVFAENERIRLTGYLADLRPALAEASVCIVPLRSGGGGTRLKILEAWAAGIPVVSTAIGAAGLEAEDGCHMLCRDDPNAFAEAVVTLLQDSELAETLARNARRFAELHYDWMVSGTRLIEVLERVRASVP